MRKSLLTAATFSLMNKAVMKHMRDVAYAPINFIKERKDDNATLRRAQEKRQRKANTKQTQNLLKGNKNV